MSHFAVAVIHNPDQDIDELLAPYSENLEVPKYIRFTKQEAIDYARENYAKGSETDEELYQAMIVDKEPEMLDKEGNIYSTYNPDSKWDWYVEGGRFSGWLKVGDTEVDEATIGDVDFSPDEEDYARQLRFWDVVVDHKPDTLNEGFASYYREGYFLEHYGDRETYARRVSGFSTYAVVTPDGVWHSKGNMGWWGMSDETAEEAADWDDHYLERFIDTADKKDIITIVDCHI